MTRPLRRHDLVHCATDIQVALHNRDDYIVRRHELVDRATPDDGSGLIVTLRTWRRRYVTRRQLVMLDSRGLADVGIDPRARDHEIAKPFWKP